MAIHELRESRIFILADVATEDGTLTFYAFGGRYTDNARHAFPFADRYDAEAFTQANDRYRHLVPMSLYTALKGGK
jgi:hypothetical protein